MSNIAACDPAQGCVLVGIPHFTPEHGECAYVISGSYVWKAIQGTSLVKPECFVADQDCIAAFERLTKLEKDAGYESIRLDIYGIIGLMKDMFIWNLCNKECLKYINIKNSYIVYEILIKVKLPLYIVFFWNTFDILKDTNMQYSNNQIINYHVIN
jgi:hypothetical protein